LACLTRFTPSACTCSMAKLTQLNPTHMPLPLRCLHRVMCKSYCRSRLNLSSRTPSQVTRHTHNFQLKQERHPIEEPSTSLRYNDTDPSIFRTKPLPKAMCGSWIKKADSIAKRNPAVKIHTSGSGHRPPPPDRTTADPYTIHSFRSNRTLTSVDPSSSQLTTTCT
jgi:hypothetical protein